MSNIWACSYLVLSALFLSHIDRLHRSNVVKSKRHFSYVGSDDPNSFFETSERSRMVYDLLLRTRYDSEEVEKYRVGIERLMKNGTYTAAYPLHEVNEFCFSIYFLMGSSWAQLST